MFRALRRRRTIDDCPTSKTQGVFIGLSELKGTAECENPLTSYLAGQKCVYYKWQVDEHWSRTDGKNRQSGWKKVAGDVLSVPFYLKDDTGVIRILPYGAEVDGDRIFDEYCNRRDALYYDKGPRKAVSNSTHKRRFYEIAVPLHNRLYVIGQSRERKDIVAAEVAKDKSAPMFVISTRTEKQIRNRLLCWFWCFLILGLLCALGGTYAYMSTTNFSSAAEWQPFAIVGGAYVFVFIIGWVWNVYNSLINLRNRVKQGWSQVDVQLKRRYDLIPNLVKTVEGYRDYESDVQCLVAELRNQTQATPPGEKGADFAGVSSMLNILVEKYPELKASQSFLSLQKQLSETEQRIALARDYYNDIATFYNTRLEIIPDRFIAAIARLKPRTLMGAADFERAPVQVKLAV